MDDKLCETFKLEMTKTYEGIHNLETTYDFLFRRIKKFLKSIDKDIKDELLESFIPLALLILFNLMIINDKSKKSLIREGFLIQIVRIFSISESNKVSNEEKSICTTIASIVLGITSESLKNGRSTPNTNKIQLYNDFLKNFIIIALPGLTNSKFNLEIIKNLLQLISMIKTDYVSNIKNPARLKEILENFLNVLGLLFPSFNHELALALVGLAFGDFNNIKQILTNYFISNAKLQTEKLAANKPEDELSENVNSLPNINKVKNSIIEKKSDINAVNNDILNDSHIMGEKYLDKVNSIFTYMQEIQEILNFSSLKVKLPTFSPEQAF